MPAENAEIPELAASPDDTVRVRIADPLTVVGGRVSWEILDRRAFTDVQVTWRAVLDRADTIWTR